MYCVSSGDRKVLDDLEDYRASRVAAQMIGTWSSSSKVVPKLEVLGCSSDNESSAEESPDGNNVVRDLLCTCIDADGLETTLLMIIVGNNVVNLVDLNGDLVDTFIYDNYQTWLKSCRNHVLYWSDTDNAPCRMTADRQQFRAFQEKRIVLSDKQRRCLEEGREKNRARSCGFLAGIWRTSAPCWGIKALDIQKVSERLVCTISMESGTEMNCLVFPKQGCVHENVFVMLIKKTEDPYALCCLRSENKVCTGPWWGNGFCLLSTFERMSVSSKVICNASANACLQKRLRGWEDAILAASKRSRSNH
mmetsp:Transcript_132086/g.232688  ORF Transcript_132086/g.232688 Transcript_132086/m.232688 type:complete len:306 (-) Transcript_132086:854-1771(-)